MKEIIINFSEEQGNYLQRLGNEVDSKAFLIDRMFTNHAADDNTQVFDSVPFKHYMKEFEKAQLEWELAKQEFEQGYLKEKVKEITGKENVSFSWLIDDYLSHECKVTIND